MYKIYTKNLAMLKRHVQKILFIMRLTTAILIVTMLQVSANSFAQSLTYVQKDATLVQLFKEIKKQTGYNVVWNEKKLNVATVIDADFRNATLEEVLDKGLKGLPVTYVINNKTVTIKKKEPSFLDNLVNRLIAMDVRGRVVDERGLPLIGATVKIKSTGTTVKTDESGAFILNTAETSGTLIISYLGYKTSEVHFDTHALKQFNVVLEQDESNLNEVEINAGYYTVKDKERTGSISRITAETIGKQPITNPLQALQGTMPGIYVQQTSGVPGANINVQIRGQSSIDAGNNPFYIVDGVPFTSQTLSSIYSSNQLFGASGSSPLNSLSPEDIESIELLKDADATAIYGSQGANGVVLITTKKGKTGRTQISVYGNSGFSRVTRMLEMMNTQQYLQMRREAFANDGISPSVTNYDVNGTWDQNRYTDWQKELLGKTARFGNAGFSISGGNSNTVFLLSGNYQKQTTVYPGDFNFRRYTSHFSAGHNSANGKFKANFSVIYTADENKLFTYDLTTQALFLAPNAPDLYNADGSLNWEKSTWINPLRETLKDFRAKGRTLNSNAVISYQLFTGLSIKASLGYSDNRLNDRSTTPSTYDDPGQGQSTAYAFTDFNTASLQSWIAEPQINWERDTRYGKINVLVGMTLQNQQRDQQVIRGQGFSSDVLATNPMAATTLSVRDYLTSAYRYEAVFGRINYNYKGKYILNLTGRRDGSSRFGPGKQFANFGAVGAAWLFSKEGFFEQLSFLSSGKLRGSYGISGNDQIGDYEYLDLYSASGAYDGVAGLNPTRLFNPDFAWEVNKKAEIGLDLGFLNERFFLSVDWYRNRSSNQLVKYPLAMTTGFSIIRDNLAAEIQNTGFEFELNTVNLKTKWFNWSSSLNLTIPKNKLLAFPGLAGSTYATKYIVGQPVTIRKLYKNLGVNPQTGIWEFEDVNKDGKITAADDKQTAMDIGQRFYGGLNNILSYKSLEVSFLFQFVKQNAPNFLATSNNPPGKASQPAAFFGVSWQKPGDIVSVQRYTTGANTQANTAFNNYISSDAAITDASFIRLKNVQVSYDFKSPVRGISSARVYLQGQNLLTATSYFGLDPETANLILPPLKTFTIGTQLNF